MIVFYRVQGQDRGEGSFDLLHSVSRYAAGRVLDLWSYRSS